MPRSEAVSFGKEKPAVPGSDEEAMAKNRRAELELPLTIPTVKHASGSPRPSRPACSGVQARMRACLRDDEARRAILDLRQKVDGAQQRTAEELRKTTEDNAQPRRSLLDLSNQIEALRNELAQPCAGRTKTSRAAWPRCSAPRRT